MCAWPVRNCIRRLKDLCSKFMNRVVGLSMGAMVFAEWNPELCGFGWLLHLKVHASSISLLWRDDMKACVLKSCLSGLLLAPSFASWSAFSLPHQESVQVGKVRVTRSQPELVCQPV